MSQLSWDMGNKKLENQAALEGNNWRNICK